MTLPKQNLRDIHMGVVEFVNKQYRMDIREHTGPRDEKRAEAIGFAGVLLINQGLSYSQAGSLLNRDGSAVHRAVSKFKDRFGSWKVKEFIPECGDTSQCDKPHAAKGLCASCYAAKYYRDIRDGKRKPTRIIGDDQKRFMSNVDIDLETDCWNWIGNLKDGCKPRFVLNNKSIMAQRYAYLMSYGHLPEGVSIKRTCGNRLCVNPDHLQADYVEYERRINAND